MAGLRKGTIEDDVVAAVVAAAVVAVVVLCGRGSVRDGGGLSQ